MKMCKEKDVTAIKITVCPANVTSTKGSTRSLSSPVIAFLTLARRPEFMIGRPSAL